MIEDKKFLVVMSDDFGMSPEVNEGIADAFENGILTDTNLMVPCPAFNDAAAIAKQLGLPCGLHSTFTCDWDIYRWKSLTGIKSMVDSDGFFKSTVEDAWANANQEEAYAELLAQCERIEAAGIKITHVGEHMGVDKNFMHASVMERLCVEKEIPYKGTHSQGWQKNYDFSGSVYQLTSAIAIYEAEAGAEVVKPKLKEFLFSLEPGYHMWVVHVAKNDRKIDEWCTEGWPPRIWARAYRAQDYSLVTDPEVKEWIEQAGITLCPVTDVPVK